VTPIIVLPHLRFGNVHKIIDLRAAFNDALVELVARAQDVVELMQQPLLAARRQLPLLEHLGALVMAIDLDEVPLQQHLNL